MKNIVNDFKENQQKGDIDLENNHNILSLDKDGNISLTNDAFTALMMNKNTKEFLLKAFVSTIINNKIHFKTDDFMINNRSLNLDLLNRAFKKKKSIHGEDIIVGETELTSTILTYSYDPLLRKNVLIRRPANTFIAGEEKLLPKAIEETGVSNNIQDLIDDVLTRYDFLNDNK